MGTARNLHLITQTWDNRLNNWRVVLGWTTDNNRDIKDQWCDISLSGDFDNDLWDNQRVAPPSDTWHDGFPNVSQLDYTATFFLLPNKTWKWRVTQYWETVIFGDFWDSSPVATLVTPVHITPPDTGGGGVANVAGGLEVYQQTIGDNGLVTAGFRWADGTVGSGASISQKWLDVGPNQALPDGSYMSRPIGLAANSIAIGGLTPGVRYYWRVTYLVTWSNGTQDWIWSDTANFTATSADTVGPPYIVVNGNGNTTWADLTPLLIQRAGEFHVPPWVLGAIALQEDTSGNQRQIGIGQNPATATSIGVFQLELGVNGDAIRIADAFGVSRSTDAARELLMRADLQFQFHGGNIGRVWNERKNALAGIDGVPSDSWSGNFLAYYGRWPSPDEYAFVRTLLANGHHGGEGPVWSNAFTPLFVNKIPQAVSMFGGAFNGSGGTGGPTGMCVPPTVQFPAGAGGSPYTTIQSDGLGRIEVQVIVRSPGVSKLLVSISGIVTDFLYDAGGFGYHNLDSVPIALEGLPWATDLQVTIASVCEDGSRADKSLSVRTPAAPVPPSNLHSTDTGVYDAGTDAWIFTFQWNKGSGPLGILAQYMDIATDPEFVNYHGTFVGALASSARVAIKNNVLAYLRLTEQLDPAGYFMWSQSLTIDTRVNVGAIVKRAGDQMLVSVNHLLYQGPAMNMRVQMQVTNNQAAFFDIGVSDFQVAVASSPRDLAAVGPIRIATQVTNGYPAGSYDVVLDILDKVTGAKLWTSPVYRNVWTVVKQAGSG